MGTSADHPACRSAVLVCHFSPECACACSICQLSGFVQGRVFPVGKTRHLLRRLLLAVIYGLFESRGQGPC